jgi:hypothetical protein
MPATHKTKIQVTGPSKEQVSKAVDAAIAEGTTRLADEVQKQWLRHAEMKLQTTAEEYMNGVSVSSDEDTVTVQIKGWLPVALEAGRAPFDMKPGLLDGRDFRIIPMHDGEFRTVSSRSPSGSWWHPGFEPRAIHEEVMNDMDDLIQRSFGPAFARVKV